MVGGLQNIGNTCYINSLLQCIYSIDVLRNNLPDDSLLALQMRDIFNRFNENQGINPGGFIHAVYLTYPSITPHEEHDIGELWTLICDTFSKVWNPFIQGESISVTECFSCKEQVINTEKFIMLTLDFDTSSPNIIDMLVSFFKVEDLTDWTCDKCKHKLGRKQSKLNIVPPVIIILIKRFLSVSEKNNNPVDIPLEFNIYDSKYTLKSIGNHFGSLSNGHYTACVKADDKYLHIDDISITQLSNFDTFLFTNQAAYMIFYEKN